MIRSDAEYQTARRKLEEDRDYALQLKSSLLEQGLTEEQAERAMEPTISYHAQLCEEVEWYERVLRREFDPFSLTQIGRVLVALRIANGLSQKDLAQRLEVSEAQVSRDENNEYHGVTMRKAQHILDVLGETVTGTVAGAGSVTGSVAATGAGAVGVQGVSAMIGAGPSKTQDAFRENETRELIGSH